MAESNHVSERWDNLLADFRQLGGTANNVVQRKGKFGLGLFPIDPSQPVELRVPDHLLVASDNLQLQGGEITLKDDSVHPEGFGEWYTRLQRDYSWGAEARQSIHGFEQELRNLPVKIQQGLNRFCPGPISERLKGKDDEQDLFKRFILTRQIKRGDRAVLMPIIELINHSPNQKSWGMNAEDISVTGTFEGEILVRYSVSDPIHRFLQYGFHCPETMAFSMSMRLMHRGKMVNLRGGINFSPFKPATVVVKEDKIVIDRPLLGSDSRPRMPRTLFRQACDGINGINADELFDQIHRQNRLVIINLLRDMDQLKSDFSHQLRETCLDQLNVLSDHLGSLSDDQIKA